MNNEVSVNLSGCLEEANVVETIRSAFQFNTGFNWELIGDALADLGRGSYKLEKFVTHNLPLKVVFYNSKDFRTNSPALFSNLSIILNKAKEKWANENEEFTFEFQD